LIREKDPYGRALGALRTRLRSGVFAPGAPLPIAELARDLDLSPTPVREALARLAGEGLVEDRRGRGYFNWRLDVIDLVELVELHGVHVATAVRGAMARGRPARQEETGARDLLVGFGAEAFVAASEAVFAGIARSGGSHALAVSQGQVAGRLAVARRLEPEFLAGAAEELQQLERFCETGAWADVARAADRYHLARKDHAALIVAGLRDGVLSH